MSEKERDYRYIAVGEQQAKIPLDSLMGFLLVSVRVLNGKEVLWNRTFLFASERIKDRNRAILLI